LPALTKSPPRETLAGFLFAGNPAPSNPRW
jgi:hypothetical protein